MAANTPVYESGPDRGRTSSRREAHPRDLFQGRHAVRRRPCVHVPAARLDGIDDLVEHAVEQAECMGLDREHVRHRHMAAVDERNCAVPHVQRVLVAGHRLVRATAPPGDVAVGRWCVAVHLLGQDARVLRGGGTGAEPGDVGRAHHQRRSLVGLDEVAARVEGELDRLVAESGQLAGHRDVLVTGDVHHRLDEPALVRSAGGKYIENRRSVSVNPPCTYRWRTGSSRHSSMSTNGSTNSGSGYS